MTKAQLQAILSDSRIDSQCEIKFFSAGVEKTYQSTTMIGEQDGIDPATNPSTPAFTRIDLA